jgi:predicted RNA-binding Zn-ribbon protein involved in translation (DUF1610 family)
MRCKALPPRQPMGQPGNVRTAVNASEQPPLTLDIVEPPEEPDKVAETAELPEVLQCASCESVLPIDENASSIPCATCGLLMCLKCAKLSPEQAASIIMNGQVWVCTPDCEAFRFQCRRGPQHKRPAESPPLNSNAKRLTLGSQRVATTGEEGPIGGPQRQTATSIVVEFSLKPGSSFEKTNINEIFNQLLPIVPGDLVAISFVRDLTGLVVRLASENFLQQLLNVSSISDLPVRGVYRTSSTQQESVRCMIEHVDRSLTDDMILEALKALGALEAKRISYTESGRSKASGKVILRFPHRAVPKSVTLGCAVHAVVSLVDPKSCHRCQSYEHMVAECPHAGRLCFRCAGSGHIARDCTQDPKCLNCGDAHSTRDGRCQMRRKAILEAKSAAVDKVLISNGTQQQPTLPLVSRRGGPHEAPATTSYADIVMGGIKIPSVHNTSVNRRFPQTSTGSTSVRAGDPRLSSAEVNTQCGASHPQDSASCGCHVDHGELARAAVGKALAEMLPQAAKEAVDGALTSVIERAVATALQSLVSQFNAVTGKAISVPPSFREDRPQDGAPSGQPTGNIPVGMTTEGSHAVTHATQPASSNAPSSRDMGNSPPVPGSK